MALVPKIGLDRLHSDRRGNVSPLPRLQAFHLGGTRHARKALEEQGSVRRGYGRPASAHMGLRLQPSPGDIERLPATWNVPVPSAPQEPATHDAPESGVSVGTEIRLVLVLSKREDCEKEAVRTCLLLGSPWDQPG